MGNLFNPEAPLMQGLGKIADMMLLNVLTVLLSLPVVTAGAATAALYDATWRILQDEGSVYGAYFRAFKSNFKQATVLWLLTVASGALLLFCLLFYLNNSMQVLVVLASLILLLWSITEAWIFPLQSRFENPVRITLKNAIYCAIGYLPRSLVMAALNLLPWVVFLFQTTLWLQMGFIWAVIWFALAAYVNMRLIRKPFKKLMGIEDVPAEQEQEES